MFSSLSVEGVRRTQALRSEGVRWFSDLAAAAKEEAAHQHDRASIACVLVAVLEVRGSGGEVA
jgi:hypothetical protein